MRRLLTILFALMLLASSAHAQSAIYGVPGGTVEEYQGCGPMGRYVVYLLYADDGERRQFDLGIPAAQIVDVSHTGMIAIEGQIVTWDPIKAGDTASVVVSGGSCEVTAPRLALYSPRWLPRVMH
jgi:hypothetical protein